MMSKKFIRRRDLLMAVGLVPAAGLLTACGTNNPAPTGTSSAGTETLTASPKIGASPSGPGSKQSWASGGADLITVDFPEISLFEKANTCQVNLTGSATEGPCYFQVDTDKDITQGRTGVPMQLCARLIDKKCEPLQGHTIEVWHCDARGKYSGNTSGSDDADRFDLGFCTENDADAKASNYLRGQQTTDTDGRVNFKSIFQAGTRDG